MMQKLRPYLLFVVATVSSVAAQAQTTSFGFDIAWPMPSSLGTAGTLTRTVCGDVTGDARPDVFVRGGANGNGITFFGAPGETASSLGLTPTCNDFDIAPKAGAAGLDALVFVDGLGLKRLDYSLVTQTFSAPVTINSTIHWQNTVLVRSADANSSGFADYVGLKGTTTVSKVDAPKIARMLPYK